MANNFQRLFYIFKNMDRDEGCPTGYIRVEINGDKAKLQISLSNLLNRLGLDYKIYGIRKVEKQLAYTAICNVPNDNGRADIKMDIDINNVGSNKLRLEDINIFALTTHLSGRTSSIKCPLVAYTKGEIQWRDELENALLDEELRSVNSNETNNINKENPYDSGQQGSLTSKASELNQSEKINRGSETLGNPACRQIEMASDIINNKEDISKKTGNDLCSSESGNRDLIKGPEESTYGPLENTLTVGLNDNGNCNVKAACDVDAINRTGTQKTKDYVSDNETDKLNIEGVEEAETDRDAVDEKNVFQDGNEAYRVICAETVIADKQVSEGVQDDKILPSCADQLEQPTGSKEDISVQDDAGHYRDTQFSISDKFESAVTSVYNADRSVQADQERKSVLAPDDNDIQHIEFKELGDMPAGRKDSGKTVFSMPSLKEELNKSFESYNPFKMKSKNFAWWKINSPGYLNNILFRNNIRTYLLFNPKVMLAHYKYRYIIMGIRNDRRSGREYLICGVPGVYDIDQNPFGNMGSWAQTEGFKPKYGAFGYWVIMIDPRTGKLMKVK